LTSASECRPRRQTILAYISENRLLSTILAAVATSSLAVSNTCTASSNVTVTVNVVYTVFFVVVLYQRRKCDDVATRRRWTELRHVPLRQLVSWSLTSLFSTNTATSETMPLRHVPLPVIRRRWRRRLGCCYCRRG